MAQGDSRSQSFDTWGHNQAIFVVVICAYCVRYFRECKRTVDMRVVLFFVAVASLLAVFSSAAPNKTIGRVMDELKQVAVKLEQSQAMDSHVMAGVRRKCDASMARTKNALAIVDKDCQGLKTTIKGLKGQMASLRKSSKPLMTETSFLEAQGVVPTMADLPAVDTSLQQDVVAGEKLIKSLGTEDRTHPPSDNALKIAAKYAAKDVRSQLQTLQEKIADAMDKQAFRERSRELTAHALAAITATCKMYHEAHSERNNLRQEQVGTLSQVTEALLKKYTAALTKEQAHEKKIVSALEPPGNTDAVEKKIAGMLKGGFALLVNSTLGRARADAFDERNAGALAEIKRAKEDAMNLRKAIAGLQRNINRGDRKIEKDDKQFQEQVKEVEDLLLDVTKMKEAILSEKQAIEKDRSEISSVGDRIKRAVPQLKEHAKRLTKLVAASKLRGKIAAIFATVYADNLEKIKNSRTAADEAKAAADKARWKMAVQKMQYEESEKEAEKNKLGEFGAFLTGNSANYNKAKNARLRMEHLQREFKNASNVYHEESIKANVSFADVVRSIKRQNELNQTIVGLYERVVRLEEEAMVADIDHDAQNLFNSLHRDIATALFNETTNIRMEMFDIAHGIKRDNKIMKKDSKDESSHEIAMATDEVRLGKDKSEAMKRQQKVDAIKADIDNLLRAKLKKSKTATKTGLSLTFAESNSNGLEKALNAQRQLELGGLVVNKMTEDDLEKILTRIEESVHASSERSATIAASDAKASIATQTTLDELLMKGNVSKKRAISLGVLSHVALALTGSLAEAEQQYEDAKKLSGEDGRRVQRLMRGVYESEKKVKLSSKTKLQKCVEASVVETEVNALRKRAAKQSTLVEGARLKVAVAKRIVEGYEKSLAKAVAQLKEADVADAAQNDLLGEQSKRKIDKPSIEKVEVRARTQLQVAKEKLRTEEAALKEFDDEKMKILVKLKVQEALEKEKQADCSKEKMEFTPPAQVNADELKTALKKAKLAYEQYAKSSAKMSALKAVIYVLKKKQGVLKAEEAAKDSLSTQQASMESEVTNAVSSTDENSSEDINSAPQMSEKKDEGAGVVEVSPQPPIALNNDALKKMMKKNAKIAADVAEREAQNEMLMRERERRAEQRVSKLKNETDGIAEHMNDVLGSMFNDRPAIMESLEKKSKAVDSRIRKAKAEVIKTSKALKDAVAAVRAEIGSLTHARLVELKQKLREAVPNRMSHMFLNGEVLFEVEMKHAVDTDLRLKDVLNGIEEVIAHAAGINSAGVTAVTHSMDHISVRIDVRSLAKAEGIAAELKEFLQDSTASGFEGYLRRRIKAGNDFTCYAVTNVRARWTPKALVTTVAKPADKTNFQTINADAFMNTYFSLEGRDVSVVLEKHQHDQKNTSAFQKPLPFYPDPSHQNFDYRSPGAYGGVVDRLEYLRYEIKVRQLTNMYATQKAAKAQAVVELKRAQVAALDEARVGLLKLEGVSNLKNFSAESLSVSGAAELAKVDKDLASANDALNSSLATAEKETEMSRMTVLKLNELKQEEGILIQSKKAWEVHEVEYDRSQRDESASLARKKLKEEMRKAHEEKIKQQREAIELINAKKLAEKGTLGAALATGATGNSEDIKSLKQEEDKKINFLTKELKAAMEEVRTAVEASKSARLKVATSDIRQTKEIKLLKTEVAQAKANNTRFRRKAGLKLAELMRVQAGLITKVSEARAKAKAANLQKSKPLGLDALKQRIDTLDHKFNVTTVSENASGPEEEEEDSGPEGDKLVDQKKKSVDQKKKNSVDQKKKKSVDQKKKQAEEENASGPEEETVSGPVHETVASAVTGPFMTGATGTTGATGASKCPDGPCECAGLGFKLCECCVAPEIDALRAMSAQENNGNKNERVVTAFEKLRLLKVKVSHLRHKCALMTSKQGSLKRRLNELKRFVIDAKDLLARSLKLHDADQIDAHTQSSNKAEQELAITVVESNKANSRKEVVCTQLVVLSTLLKKKIAEAHKFKKAETASKMKAAEMSAEAFAKTLHLTMAQAKRAKALVEADVKEVLNQTRSGGFATGPMGSTGNHAPTGGAWSGTASASGGAYYAPGPRSHVGETGMTGMTGATGSTGTTGPTGSEDYAKELRAVDAIESETLRSAPEVYDRQASKALELVRREIALLEKAQTSTDEHKVKIESVKNWLLKVELKLSKLAQSLRKTVDDVRRSRHLDKAVMRLKNMQVGGVLDNAAGQLDMQVFDKYSTIVGEATLDQYTPLVFGSAEKLFLRTGIAKTLGIKVKAVALKDPFPASRFNSVKISFEIGVRKQSNALQARKLLVDKLEKADKIQIFGLRSSSVFLRRLYSPADSKPVPSDMTEAGSSLRQLDELAGGARQNSTYQAPDSARIDAERDIKLKQSIENAIERGTFGNLVAVEKEALMKLHDKVEMQCANIDKKYRRQLLFDAKTAGINKARRKAGLADVTEEQFRADATGNDATGNDATGLYGGLRETSGPQASSTFLQVENGPTGITGTEKISELTDAARAEFQEIINADDVSSENVKSIHLIQEEIERIMTQKESRMYKDTVEAVSEGKVSTLNLHNPLQLLYLNAARAAQDVAKAMIAKNQRMQERANGRAVDKDVTLVKKAEERANEASVNATKALNAGKIALRVRARKSVEDHLLACTKRAKLWYDKETKKKEEQALKQIERNRLKEAATKAEEAKKAKHKREQSIKDAKKKRDEETKKMRVSEQKLKDSETVRGKILRLLKQAQVDKNWKEEIHLRQELTFLDQTETAQRSVDHWAKEKKNSLLSKNATLIVNADAKLRAAINNLNRLLLKKGQESPKKAATSCPTHAPKSCGNGLCCSHKSPVCGGTLGCPVGKCCARPSAPFYRLREDDKCPPGAPQKCANKLCCPEKSPVCGGTGKCPAGKCCSATTEKPVSRCPAEAPIQCEGGDLCCTHKTPICGWS